MQGLRRAAGCFPGGGDHVGGASAAAAAAAGPAVQDCKKLYFREVFRAVVHRRQRVFHRRRASIHTGAAGVA